MWKKTRGETYVQYERETPTAVSILIPLPTPIESNEIPYIRIEYTDGDDINLLVHIYQGLYCHPKISDMSYCSSFTFRYDIRLPHDFNVKIIEPLVDKLLGL